MRAALCWLATVLLLGGCTFFRSATVPMPIAHYPAPAANANGLLVLLPGIGDDPEDYATNGFVEMVQRANPRFDVICADAHFGYYRSQSVAQRLHDDVIAPVAERYEHIWIGGISLGGLGSIAFLRDHKDLIDGAILLAPYMGEQEVIEEVRRAGGLRSWQPRALPVDASASVQLSHWLWTYYHAVAEHPETMPELFLGYGEDDRFRISNGMVAETLPDRHKATLPGGHKWTVWKPLFAKLVPRALGSLR